MSSENVTVVCQVKVTIPRADLYPYDGSVTNEDYAKHIVDHPDGNLIDFAQYSSLAVTNVEVTDG
jgi:hypothetical protein